ncbi:hypothetical protein Cfla_2363 [Cellulomonas flavigena DSM 20109]|uniref:Glycosyltransferase RgtA/B/C/D-like domain-containing protein n=1 Tax=Cellulomonas flavigena (strain ATCC 482 / DSM 20109 / BCRC 11376 / JCM 18109 / NBRC 3775 / NCIMB 8073 / NRS 134) TaxID=446466 RepID=D5UHD2_CELFN|nr:hypothetical protein [Cellulomonas flavigena]ADG75253.1 hypothetical protein Cfla_2363 [Cellulomonas flavigena DSM 20109]
MHAETVRSADEPTDVAVDAAPPRPAAARSWQELAVRVAAPLAVLAVHLWVAWPRHGLVWTDDEVGPLATARLLAGQGALDLAHDSYYPLWAVALVPVWWLTDDPLRAYHLAVLLSGVCGAAVVLPLTALARRLGAGPAPATLVAAAVAVAPSRTVMSSFAIIENFLVLVLALTVVAAVRYADRPTLGRAALLGAGGAATFVAHGRMVTVVACTALWFLVELWRGPAGRRRVAALGLLTTVVVAVAGFALHVTVAGILYESGTSREAEAVVGLFGGSVPNLVRTTVGTVWYGAVAWLGLSVVGAALGVTAALRELRARRAGVALWGGLALGGNLAISVLSTARSLTEGTDRIDVPTYGRYVEPYLVLLAVVGATVLVRRLEPRRATVVAALAVTAGSSIVVVPWMLATANPDGWWGPINVPGMLALVGSSGTGLPWVAAALVAAAACVVLVLVRRSLVARRATVAVVGVWLLGSSVVAQTSHQQPLALALGDPPRLLSVVQAIDTPVSFDVTEADWPGQNRFQYWLAPRAMEVFDGTTTRPPTDLVVSRAVWPHDDADDWVLVADALGDDALWVRRGPVEADLRARGMLQPEDVTAPIEGFAATLTRTDGPADRPVPSGGPSWLEVALRNDGPTAWTGLGDLANPTGVVRVVVFWPVPGGAHPQVADLPSNVLPGATEHLRIRLDPPADVAGDAIGLTLVQEGLGELTPPGQPLLWIPLR